jgi:hypothetical protein
MTDSVAEGLARDRAHHQLLAQLARDLFGWTWRQDWQAWCPAGWPSREVFNPPYETWATPLEQHGGVPPGHIAFGSRDDRGRPKIPEYVHDRDAPELIWRWIERRCPGFGHLRFERPPSRWRCVIAWGMANEGQGTGETRAEALCRAALALAQALVPETCWHCGHELRHTAAGAVCGHCGADQGPCSRG